MTQRSYPSRRVYGLLILLVAVAALLYATAGLQAPDGQAPAPETGMAAAPANTTDADATLTINHDLVEKPWTGDLDGMVERRLIRVLTVHSKTFFFSDMGTQRGLTVDLFRLYESELNKQLAATKKLKHKNLKVQVVFIPVQRDQLLPALIAGKGDIAAANLTITPERQQLVDFSTSGISDVSEVVVSGPASPAIASLDDLAGKTFFVRKSSSYYTSLLALNQRFASENKPAVILAEAPETLEDEDLLEMLNAGLVPLLVVDKHKADFWKQVFPALTVHDSITVRTGGEVAWAMRQHSPQLKASLDDFMQRHRAGTATGNELLRRYLKSLKYVKNATATQEREKFLALIEYFRKYGTQYNIDWLLMGAQGYQESQLDQNAKSPAGAIGVMQLMPATGKDMQVGDIHNTETNIHAGIKYMRWMIDHYYANEPMTPLNKALFAFASYNAGPGRITSLRKEAARRGLDPNVWFQNVEYVAAEKIGQETVTYVSNIYKYAIAYQLLLEDQMAKQQAIKTIQAGEQ